MAAYTYQLTEYEKLNFTNDEVRSDIRQRASVDYNSDDVIHIVDTEGNLFDTLNGSKADVGLAVSVDPEKKREADTARQRLEQHKQVRNEIRAEFRESVRSHRRQIKEVLSTLDLHTSQLILSKADIENSLSNVQKALDSVNHAVSEVESLKEHLSELDGRAEELEGRGDDLDPNYDWIKDDTPATSSEPPSPLENTSTDVSGSQLPRDDVP